MFDTRVLSFSVLADEDSIDIVVRRLESLDRCTGTNIGEKLESAAECQVQRDMSLANYQGQRT